MEAKSPSPSKPEKRPLRAVKYPAKVTVSLTAETFAKVEATADLMRLPLADVCRQVIDLGIASFRTSEMKRRYAAKNYGPRDKAAAPDAG